MTSKSKIQYKMEGPEQNNHHLELSVFIKKTRQFLDLLKSSAKDSGQDEVAFHVVYLSHSSPFIVECQPFANGKPDIDTMQYINELLNYAATGQSDKINNNVLVQLNRLAKPEPKNMTSSEIVVFRKNLEEGDIYRLDDQFHAKLENPRNGKYSEINTVDGILETINIHRKPYTFRIYDASFNSAVIKCEFPPALLSQVQGALGRGVFVSGEFFHRQSASVPYKIVVREIELLPLSDELPSLSDLQGIEPGLTGDKTPEEFVRESRDSWDKNR